MEKQFVLLGDGSGTLELVMGREFGIEVIAINDGGPTILKFGQRVLAAGEGIRRWVEDFASGNAPEQATIIRALGVR